MLMTVTALNGPSQSSFIEQTEITFYGLHFLTAQKSDSELKSSYLMTRFIIIRAFFSKFCSAYRAFINHAYGIVNGISYALDSLTGEYEDDCELLSAISGSHMRRGITANMFRDLKESVLESCFLLLHSDKKSRAAWTAVLNFIFDDYLCPPNEIKKSPSLEKEVSDFCVKLP